MTADIPLMPRMQMRTTEDRTNTYLILLSAQLRFLNFNANIGSSATSKYEKIKEPTISPMPTHSLEPFVNVGW